MLATDDKIKEALTKLDPSDDSHWTTEGLPRLDVVEGLAGGSISRKAITNAAPEFTRGFAQSLRDHASDEDTAGPVDEDEDPLGEGNNQTNTEQPSEDLGQPEDTVEDDQGIDDPEDTETSSDERRADLEGQVEALEAEMETVAIALEQGRVYRQGLEERLEALKSDLRHEFPPLSAAEAIQQFQQNELAKRMEARGHDAGQNLTQSLKARGNGRAPRGSHLHKGQ